MEGLGMSGPAAAEQEHMNPLRERERHMFPKKVIFILYIDEPWL